MVISTSDEGFTILGSVSQMLTAYLVEFRGLLRGGLLTGHEV
jgi:hypothetical protein